MTSIARDMPELQWMCMDLTSKGRTIIDNLFHNQMSLNHDSNAPKIEIYNPNMVHKFRPNKKISK